MSTKSSAVFVVVGTLWTRKTTATTTKIIKLWFKINIVVNFNKSR